MNRARRPFLTITGDNATPRWLVCMLLTLAALLIHGYHPYAEDAGIYIPAIKKQLDPSLYPIGSKFFMLPAHWSVFSRTVAESVRITHLNLSYVLLLWYVASLFLTVTACWKIAEYCFNDRGAGFVGASLVTASISMPAAGCALLLVDPYLTSRSLSTPLILFSVLYALKKDYLYAFVLWIGACAFHPLMGVICGLLLLLLLAAASPRWQFYACAIAIGFAGIILAASRLPALPVSGDYRAAALGRSYFFLNQWTWYELAGAAAPIGFFIWMAWSSRQNRRSPMYQVSLATSVFGALAILGAAALTSMPALLPFARFQPMRAFQLIYVLFLLLPIVAALRAFAANWTNLQQQAAFTTLLLLIGSGMYVVQRETFPSSAHLEWPWSESRNPWQQAFEWIRTNTPKDALFALDSDYPNSPGNDRQGFRAQAERSALPDRAKDGGVTALFPQLAYEWKSSTVLTAHMGSLESDDVRKLRQAGVSWIVIPQESASQLFCPYSNRSVSVCRLYETPGSEGLKSASIEDPR